MLEFLVSISPTEQGRVHILIFIAVIIIIIIINNNNNIYIALTMCQELF